MPDEHISEFIDFHIQPLAKKVPSYIKDSGHILEIIHKIKWLDNDIWLITIDVKALYTNIRHADGLAALKEALSKADQNTPPEVLLQLCEFILKHNVFQFNNINYIQKQDTAMGTKMAPSYAILYMGQFEREFIVPRIKLPTIRDA